MPLTTKQIGMVRAILHKHGLGDEDEKRHVIREFTEGRTESISDMTHQECNRLVTAFNGESGRARMVRKMLSLAHEMEWELPGGKIDMDRINAWCRNYSPAHTDLDNIRTHELGKVLTVFEKVHMDYLKGLAK